MIFRNKFFILLTYFIISVIAYYNVLWLGFLSDDFIGLRNCSLPFTDIIHGDHLLQPISHFITLILYKLFYLNPFPYHLCSVILLSFCGFAAFLVFDLVLKLKGENNNSFKSTSFITGILVIVNPYNTEVVSWFSGKSYLLAVLFFLLSLLFFLRFRKDNTRKALILSILFYFLSLLSKEIALPFLLVIITFELLIRKVDFDISSLSFNKAIRITGVFFFTTIIYLVFRKLMIGEVIGGNGFAFHLNYAPGYVLHNLFLYHVKFFAHYRFVPEFIREMIKSIYYNRLLLIGFVLIIIIAIYFLIRRNKKLFAGNNLTILIWFYTAFVFLLIPVVNLETSFLGEIQSDRYGFLPGIFFVFLIVFFICKLFNKSHIVVLTLISILFLINTITENNSWKEANRVAESMIRSAKNFDLNNKNVLVINMPDNYHGAYVFRAGFKDALMLNQIASPKKVDFITSMGISNSGDSVIFHTNGENEQLEVTGKLYLLNINSEIDTIYNNFILKDFSRNKIIYTLREKGNPDYVFLYSDANGILNEVK